MATNNAINYPLSSVSAWVTNPVANATGDGTFYTIIYDTTYLNDGSYYNAATGVYTAPVTGVYIYNFIINSDGYLAAHTSLKFSIQINGNDISVAVACNPFLCSDATDGNFFFSGTSTFPATAGDAITNHLRVTGGTKVITVRGGTLMSIFPLI